MKGHCDRHLGGYLDGALPLEWLQSVGYGGRGWTFFCSLLWFFPRRRVVVPVARDAPTPEDFFSRSLGAFL